MAFNIGIKPEELIDKSKEALKEIENINVALKEIDDAKKALVSWQSRNKDEYERVLNENLPKMVELTNEMAAYPKSAIRVSGAMMDAEETIARNLSNTTNA